MERSQSEDNILRIVEDLQMSDTGYFVWKELIEGVEKCKSNTTKKLLEH